ncbi:Tripartite tricarboxylate transporter TctB family protein [Shimia gijangensis]|uniref:Tripartite tricarboxylate transporter TctB family protein n=1 Tax=Shimia gijangensis TaxID=1470563 RepID=A0A1M6JWV5_9RHOB|nr:tripartite tricarboxylate transporter TctB family protein [Shimia gijangensis]SHJ51118.1 Tripartite tricarboxylate transporter TctB family protein [Shimia gijangensis]
MSRFQHIIPSGLIFAVGCWIAFVSFTQQPAEAFLFPRLIASVFVVLSGWTFGKALLGKSRVGVGINRHMILNLTPGLFIAGIYVFWAAKFFGFYTASTAAFFILFSLYDPSPHSEVKTWVRRAITTAVFMLVMYGLFSLLLKVYTPREILF